MTGRELNNKSTLYSTDPFSYFQSTITLYSAALCKLSHVILISAVYDPWQNTDLREGNKKIHFVAIWFEKTKYFNFKVEIDIYRFENEMQKSIHKNKQSKIRSLEAFCVCLHSNCLPDRSIVVCLLIQQFDQLITLNSTTCAIKRRFQIPSRRRRRRLKTSIFTNYTI